MPLLADYAITPDVFDMASYSTVGECEARLDSIRQVMLTEGLVRDLRGRKWHGVFEPDVRQWHRRGLELVKKLATQGRLVPYPPALSDPPLDDRGWCAEAPGDPRAETAHRRGDRDGVGQGSLPE